MTGLIKQLAVIRKECRTMLSALLYQQVCAAPSALSLALCAGVTLILVTTYSFLISYCHLVFRITLKHFIWNITNTYVLYHPDIQNHNNSL